MNPSLRPLLDEVQAGLRNIYGTELIGVYVFGSYARGEEDGESDLDLLVVLRRIGSYGAEVQRTSFLRAALSLKHGVSISTVFLPEEDWRSGDTPFLWNVREEAVPV